MFRFATAFAMASALCGGGHDQAHAHVAEELSGQRIAEELAGSTIYYETGAVQSFYGSGKTLYEAGQPEWGNWTTEGDRYCSQWPPRAEWACYRVRMHDPMFEFIGEAGDITIGFRN